MPLTKTVIETPKHSELAREAQEMRNHRSVESTVSLDIRVSQDSPVEVHTHDAFWSNVLHFEASSRYPSDTAPAYELVAYLRSVSIVPRANIALEDDELVLQREAADFIAEVATALERDGRHVTAALTDKNGNHLITITASVFNSKICPFQKGLKNLLKEHVPQVAPAFNEETYELVLTLTDKALDAKFAFPENDGVQVAFIFDGLDDVTMDTVLASAFYEILCDGDLDVVSFDNNLADPTDTKEAEFYADLEKVCLEALEVLGDHKPEDLEVNGELVKLNLHLL